MFISFFLLQCIFLLLALAQAEQNHHNNNSNNHNSGYMRGERVVPASRNNYGRGHEESVTKKENMKKHTLCFSLFEARLSYTRGSCLFFMLVFLMFKGIVFIFSSKMTAGCLQKGRTTENIPGVSVLNGRHDQKDTQKQKRSPPGA